MERNEPNINNRIHKSCIWAILFSHVYHRKQILSSFLIDKFHNKLVKGFVVVINMEVANVGYLI